MTFGQFMALDEAGQRARMQAILAGWQRNADRRADDDNRFDSEAEARDGWANDGTP